MVRKLLLLLVFSIVPLGLTWADEVVRWVDEGGRVHFGNAQFAPPGEGQVVDLTPANGMEPPSAVGFRTGRSGGGRIVLVGRPEKKNIRGWRGHGGRGVTHSSRRRR